LKKEVIPMFTKPESIPIDTISPIEIAEIIDRLASRIIVSGNRDIFGPWASSRLAGKVGVIFAMSSNSDPASAIGEIGAAWADLIIATNREDPDRAPDLQLAAHAALDPIKCGAAGQRG
jgi:hypothetical protein